MGDVLEEASDVCGDGPELDFGVLAEADVPVVPAEVFVVVCVVVAQYLALFEVVVLEPVEPPAGVVVIEGGERLHAAAGDRTVQFERVVAGHPPPTMFYDLIHHKHCGRHTPTDS
ncbi:hypothetical protein BRD10_01320 [Halobacteriales archaeon SW_12_71_31]|nr:MAG: hypothetical protein BRD10_01320 [Halobacteriales archaeon SW_12_71_31]